MKTRTAILIIAFLLFVSIAAYIILNRNDGTYQLPISGKITSKFGVRDAPTEGASTFHNGIDISAAIGTPVKPKLPGIVKLINYDEHGGHQIIVEHPGGWQTGYAHLNAYGKFKEGDSFKARDTIAYTGASGNVTGPHLHTTLTNPTGVKMDPELYINKKLV